MASRPSTPLFARALPVTLAALAALLFTGPAGGAAVRHPARPGSYPSRRAARRRSSPLPDLILVSLSQPPSPVAPGSTFLQRFREKNRAHARASGSNTGFYLSLSGRVEAGAIHLGTARVQALKGGGKTNGQVELTVPASSQQGAYLLIGCANDGHRVKERGTRNDCRASKERVVVTSQAVTATATATVPPPAPPPPANGPGCPPTRDPGLTSSDPNCFLGDVEHGVFVSGVGDDHNSGTISAPKRTLAAGVAAAVEQKADVYVTEGVFPETLVVADGVSVFGGYSPSWQRSPSHVTKIIGEEPAAVAAVAAKITTPTTLQLLSLVPEEAKTQGTTSYGLRGVGSPALVLDHVTIVAAPGTSGNRGSTGQTGASGDPGHDSPGSGPGAGGSSAAAHPGGKGGNGGFNGENGYEGEAGQLTEPDYWGRMGGPGGPGGEGSSNPKVGGPGYAGDSGLAGSDGAGGQSVNVLSALHAGLWMTEGGHSGTAGTSGHGGGGGGGGGSDSCLFGEKASGGGGGGGGGGGQGGGAGGGGQGGGGSFGIYLEDSTGASVRDSSVTASAGGDGGVGGSGGYGGAGGGYGEGAAGFAGGTLCSAGAAKGGHGGLGGPGGIGGDGGGGAGGPSVAIFGLEAPAAPGTTVSHGPGGAGAVGEGGTGANGVASDFG
jgi:hypothetical protein